MNIFVELVIEWSDGKDLTLVNDNVFGTERSQDNLKGLQGAASVVSNNICESKKSQDMPKPERDATVLSDDNGQVESDSSEQEEPCPKKAREQASDHDGYSMPQRHSAPGMHAFAEPNPPAYWNPSGTEMASEPMTAMMVPTATSSEELPGNRVKPEWDGAPTDPEWDAVVARVSLAIFDPILLIL